MNIRAIAIEEEYEAIARWWTLRDLVAPQKVLLQAADGFIVQHTGRDLVAGWIYMTHRGIVGIVEWTTSNPEHNEPDLVAMAVDLLYSFMEKYALDSGCTALFCSTKDKSSLARRMVLNGWSQCIGDPHAMFVKKLPL